MGDDQCARLRPDLSEYVPIVVRTVLVAKRTDVQGSVDGISGTFIQRARARSIAKKDKDSVYRSFEHCAS